MLRKVFVGVFVGLLVVTLAWTVSAGAQMKEKEKDSKPVALKLVDINSASQTEVAGVGLTDSLAKKIVESRPFRNKRELLTRNLVTPEQYEKIKDLIIAKRPPAKK